VVLFHPEISRGGLPTSLDYRTEVPILPLETILIFPEEQLEIVKKHPVKHRLFRMTLAVDPCHSRGE
jgi:hypothetical protein